MEASSRNRSKVVTIGWPSADADAEDAVTAKIRKRRLSMVDGWHGQSAAMAMTVDARPSLRSDPATLC